MQAILPQHWGAAVAQTTTALAKAAAQPEALATVVAGHVLQFVGEGVPAAKPTVKAAPRLARPKVAPTQPLAAKRAVRPAVSAATRRAAQPMTKSVRPATPITNTVPELMIKSWTAIDRANQLDAELRERLAQPGRFL